MMEFVSLHSAHLHKDTLKACMTVIGRLVPRMEPKDASLDTCVASLSDLLKHSDPQVADAAMKCFVMLADRFIRRACDTAPIASKGLIDELVNRLGAAGSQLTPGGQSGGTAEKPSTQTVSTIVNLLATLCRGSASITHVRMGREEQYPPGLVSCVVLTCSHCCAPTC